jgi:type IV pilus assembly protein PilA
VLQNTLKKIRARRDGEEGFTLIELMVVVLIIAILIAIAIPTFLGASNRAKDKAAESSVRNAFTNAKTLYTDSQDYTKATPAALAASEPSLQFCVSGTATTDCNATGDSVGPNGIVVQQGSTVSIIQLVARSKAGKCFALMDNEATGGTKFTSYADTNNACTAASIPGESDASWAEAWS